MAWRVAFGCPPRAVMEGKGRKAAVKRKAPARLDAGALLQVSARRGAVARTANRIRRQACATLAPGHKGLGSHSRRTWAPRRRVSRAPGRMFLAATNAW